MCGKMSLCSMSRLAGVFANAASRQVRRLLASITSLVTHHLPGACMSKPVPTPFRLQVPDETLKDLRERLSRVRWPDEPPVEPWSTGTSVGYMRQLVEYWRDRFDWRAQEEALNRFHHFKVSLAGIDLHFIHEQGKGPSPMPLV